MSEPRIAAGLPSMDRTEGGTAAAPKAPPDYPDAELERLMVLADRGTLLGSVTVGVGHTIANVLQALAIDGNPGGVALAREKLGLSVRILTALAASEESAPTPVIVPDAIAEVSEWQRFQRGSARAHIRIEVEPFLPAARARSSSLRHALLAIVTNAKEALSKEAREILIEAYAETSGIAIAIEDDGPGIDDASREEVFEAFHTTKDPAFHPGLGLTVGRHLLALDGGQVSIETPRRLGGARVMLRLQRWGGSRPADTIDATSRT